MFIPQPNLTYSINSNSHRIYIMPSKTISIYDIKEEVNPITSPFENIIEYRQRIDIIATAYTASRKETAGLGITASGKQISRGMVATHMNIPFGTKLFIDTIGHVTVEDRGNQKYLYWVDNHTIRVDIFMESRKKALDFGVKKLNGYIYRKLRY